MTFNRAPGESCSPARTPQPNINLLVLMRPGQGRGRGKSIGMILLVNSQPSSLSSLSPPSKYSSCPQVPDFKKKKKEALKTRIQGALPPSISARTRVSYHPRNLALHTYPKIQGRKEGRRGGSRCYGSWVGIGLTQSAFISFSRASLWAGVALQEVILGFTSGRIWCLVQDTLGKDHLWTGCSSLESVRSSHPSLLPFSWTGQFHAHPCSKTEGKLI